MLTDHPTGDSVTRVHRVFAFVDLSGFTAFTAQQGDTSAVNLLADFRRVVRLVASHKGVRVAKWLGDGAMLVGLETELLVEAIVDIEMGVQQSDSPLALRAGIAEGNVILFEGDDYIGQPVNLAARLCDLAQPEQVLAPSSLVSSMMVNTDVTEIGAHSVAGLEEPIELVSLDSAAELR